MVIAIDGYSSCGKSTLAKALAAHLGFTFVDTGAMYRAVTLYIIEHQIDLDDLTAIETALEQNITIHLSSSSEGIQSVWLNESDVTRSIRLADVADRVSDVASIEAVRFWLVEQQQAMGKTQSVVMDGRDIGTVVFPGAEVKIFVTADVETRVKRRYEELLATGIQSSIDDVRYNLIKRDHIDSTRLHSPLRRADDAYLLDNTHLSKEEQLQVAMRLVDRAS